MRTEYNAFGYSIEDELLTRETEQELFRMFEELDGLILDNLPTSLITEPSRLIQQEYYQKTGLLLTKQEIVDAYLRFSEGIYD